MNIDDTSQMINNTSQMINDTSHIMQETQEINDIQHTLSIPQQIWNSMYPLANKKLVSEYYEKSGYYMFKRKMHSGNQYQSFKAANHGNASSVTLTHPAFPKYLLPPDSIIDELSKSPRLESSSHIRADNWAEQLGDFVHKIYESNIRLGHVEQLFKKYLIENGLPRHIYSVFQIDKLYDKLTGNVCYRSIHVFDITQKMDSSWSRKSDKYSFPIYPYITVIVKKQHSSFFSHELSFNKSYKLQQFTVI